MFDHDINSLEYTSREATFLPHSCCCLSRGGDPEEALLLASVFLLTCWVGKSRRRKWWLWELGYLLPLRPRGLVAAGGTHSALCLRVVHFEGLALVQQCLRQMREPI